tara:strand:+ start:3782 stop:4708 length:927 start_codon:yes stop_codon:yes gene_type:complete
MTYKLILEKALATYDQPNLILYGHHSINKLNILKDHLKIDKYPLTEIIKNDIIYFSNKNIKIFDISHVKKSKIEGFFNIISEIVKCKNHYIDGNRIVVLYNFNHINKAIQSRFRVIFEKYRINTVFILLTDNFNSIIDPIISRFLSIRIGDLNRNKKISLCYPNIRHLTYDQRCIIYDKIYDNEDETTILNYSKNNYGLLNDTGDVVNYIYLSIKNMKKLNYSLLKEYAYMIEKYHLKYLHRRIAKIMIDDLSLTGYTDIIKTIAECEMRYKKSFNRILSNEFLLMFIYEKTHENLARGKEVNRNEEE